jgi:hypothetical protein
MNALRSVLDIPMIGAGQASYLMALHLGSRFSILQQWEPFGAWSLFTDPIFVAQSKRVLDGMRKAGVPE